MGGRKVGPGPSVVLGPSLPVLSRLSVAASRSPLHATSRARQKLGRFVSALARSRGKSKQPAAEQTRLQDHGLDGPGTIDVDTHHSEGDWTPAEEVELPPSPVQSVDADTQETHHSEGSWSTVAEEELPPIPVQTFDADTHHGGGTGSPVGVELSSNPVPGSHEQAVAQGYEDEIKSHLQTCTSSTEHPPRMMHLFPWRFGSASPLIEAPTWYHTNPYRVSLNMVPDRFAADLVASLDRLDRSADALDEMDDVVDSNDDAVDPDDDDAVNPCQEAEGIDEGGPPQQAWDTGSGAGQSSTFLYQGLRMLEMLMHVGSA